MTVFAVKDHHGTPTLFMDDRPIFTTIYLTVRNFRNPGMDWQPDPHFEQFRDAGFHFYSIELPTRFDDAYDPATGGFRLEAFARLEGLKHYAAVDPQAKFLLRVGVEPRGDESAWIQQHRDQCEVLEARAKGIYATPSYASKIWLKDAAEFIRTLIRYIYEHDLSDHILGYLICGGDSAEWVKIGPMEDWASDYSEPMQQVFRHWLRAKYGTVQALREAWDDPHVDFEQSLVPSPEEQGDADLFLFKDPRKRRRAIDHFQCLASVVASDIDFLCGVAKEACHREHLAGVFYGYVQEIVWNNGFFGQRLADADVAHAAGARSGHAGLKQVLQSPNVDFLSSPYSYGFRGVGGEGAFMSPQESVRRAGKLWVSEEDMRTHLWPPDSFYGQTRNTRETGEVLKRQMANLITHGAGAWWCDWGKPAGGAFAEPELMQLFQRSLEIGRHHLTLPERTSAAQVAVVIDAESAFYRSTLNNFDIPSWRNHAWGIVRMGAPADVILLSDLLEGRTREYKFYFLANTVHFSAHERETLKSVLRRDGKLALWVYAPGFVDEELSVDYCHDITGIKLRMTPRQWGVNIFLSNFEHPVTQHLPTSTFWGTDMRLGPLFTVDDPNVVTLGTAVINQGRCEPGFVIRQNSEWASVYSAAPNIPPGVLRELARHAGVHIFNESEDVMYADRAYVALHTVRAGEKTIRLPHRADVWEVYSNRQVGRDCVEFSDHMDAGTTHLYYYGPAPGP
ncbi:MAG: beta-galactosidase [Chloroflexi bacterium]|nr:beta-galactosidase [Chloroflexota bacterium]